MAVRCVNSSCPSLLKENKFKLAINLETDQSHCWCCPIKHRTLLPILRRYYPQHIQEYVNNFLKREIYKPDLDNEINHEEEKLCLPYDFVLLATKTNTIDPNIKKALNYIYKRGITIQDLWYYQIGYSQQDQVFGGRIIFPSFDKKGELNFITSRAIDKFDFPTYKHCSVDKNNIIFNEMRLDFTQEITIVEGPFDLVKSNKNTACILGSSLNEDHKVFLQILKNQTPVLLALDQDMQKRSHKLAKLFNLYDINVRILPLGNFKDVGDMTKKDFLYYRQQAKAWTCEDKLLQLIQTISS